MLHVCVRCNNTCETSIKMTGGVCVRVHRTQTNVGQKETGQKETRQKETRQRETGQKVLYQLVQERSSAPTLDQVSVVSAAEIS